MRNFTYFRNLICSNISFVASVSIARQLSINDLPSASLASESRISRLVPVYDDLISANTSSLSLRYSSSPFNALSLGRPESLLSISTIVFSSDCMTRKSDFSIRSSQVSSLSSSLSSASSTASSALGLNKEKSNPIPAVDVPVALVADVDKPIRIKKSLKNSTIKGTAGITPVSVKPIVRPAPNKISVLITACVV